MPPLLSLFAFANLVIGSGAFVVSSLVTPMAADLGTSVAGAGQAMTAYALSTAALAPVLLIATGRWSRRSALLAALALFAGGNLVCALAPDLATLLAGRVLMGVGAAFTPIAAGIAIALSEPARRGQALAYVFLGMSLSYVVGIPLGAWLGLAWGWRWTVGAAGGVAIGVLGLVAWRVPRDVKAPGASFAGLGVLLSQPGVTWPLVMTLLYFTAIFSVFSFIGPVLQALNETTANRLAITLALFGVAGAVGTVVGGWANDRFGTRRTLIVQLGVLAAMLAAVPLTTGVYPLTLAALLVWGMAGFGMMAPQQSRLADAAGAQAPLALSLNTSMLYGGTAIGAVVGGLASPVLGFARIAWAGLPFALAALAVLILTQPTSTTMRSAKEDA
jgi:DHA1 family inner membrane transport protein